MHEINDTDKKKTIVITPLESPIMYNVLLIGVFIEFFVPADMRAIPIMKRMEGVALCMVLWSRIVMVEYKTITLNSEGIMLKWWVLKKFLKWDQVQLWENKVVCQATSRSATTSYKKALVIAPDWVRRPKIMAVEHFETFFHPLAFAIIRYKPDSFKKGEIRHFEYDKEALLIQLDAWGVIDIDEWKKKYP